MKSLEDEISNTSFLIGDNFILISLFYLSLFIEDFNCLQAIVYLANLQVQIKKYKYIQYT